ncbi:MAG: uroporphyrinogen decarboxylase family protein [Spirochaetia bacterium]
MKHGARQDAEVVVLFITNKKFDIPLPKDKGRGMMNPRERVAASLDHRVTDRPVIDLGGQSNTSLTQAAFDALGRYWGSSDAPAGVMARHFQTVEIPENYLLKFGVDVRGVKPGKPRISCERTLPDGSFIDYWGVTFTPALGGTYYDISGNPLRTAEYDQLDDYHPFDPADPGITDGVEERARRAVDAGFALIGNLTETQIFERAWYARGFDQFLMDLHLDKRFTHKLLRIVTDLQIRRVEQFLKKVGRYLSIVRISDDLAGQLSPLMSPETYRELLKPYHREFFDSVRKLTDARIALHSCGNVRPLIPDIIDTGVQVLHPFQHCADAMEPAGLKREFGADLVFWGGMDTQKFLPNATPAEVRAEVRRITGIMCPKGGYIFSPTHNLQGDVPPKNVVAMYEEALKVRCG